MTLACFGHVPTCRYKIDRQREWAWTEKNRLAFLSRWAQPNQHMQYNSTYSRYALSGLDIPIGLVCCCYKYTCSYMRNCTRDSPLPAFCLWRLSPLTASEKGRTKVVISTRITIKTCWSLRSAFPVDYLRVLLHHISCTTRRSVSRCDVGTPNARTERTV
jgi:hypothetical protein